MSGEGWLHSPMELPRIGAVGWLRAVLRGLPLAVVIYGGLALLLLVRLVERPICGMDRPVSPWITQGVCRAAVWLLGLRLVVRGQPMRGRGAVVANHASWLDIFVLNAVDRVYFVSKAEVAGWAGIGWLARATGTVFITRKGAEAREQQRLFEARLRAGHRLCFFPEGTSTDSRRILPFKSTLFAAFFTHGMEHVVQLQPVTVVYRPAHGVDARYFGWWGEMDFAPHLLSVLAARRGGEVAVILHQPRPADTFGDRKALAAWCEATVRGAHPDGQAAYG